MSTFWSPGYREPISADPGAAGDARRARSLVEQLEERLDKLTLINWALWTLIQETTQLKEEDLMERVKQLDLLDGSPDGRVTRQLAKCSQCNRIMSPRHIRCIYCGYEKLNLGAFDALL